MFWYGLLLFVLLRRLIPLAVLVLVIWLVVRALKKGKGPGFRREDPLEVLKVRYARGEVSREEYERMKGELKT